MNAKIHLRLSLTILIQTKYPMLSRLQMFLYLLMWVLCCLHRQKFWLNIYHHHLYPPRERRADAITREITRAHTAPY